MEFFNKMPRNCIIGTANNKGEVNVAVFGSPRMIDENTVVLGTGHKCSYHYLGENPKAAIIAPEPGDIMHATKALRVYLEVASLDTKETFLA
jgi:hypothetical protein